MVQQGYSMVSEQSIATFAELSEFVKSYKLRRLGNILTSLKEELHFHPTNQIEIARLLSDAWFTVAAIRKHLQDGLKNPVLLDELVGKTWRKTELERVSGLNLVELGYERQLLTSGFIVETSMLIDLNQGTLFAEKQITPQKMNISSKASYFQVLEADSAYLYPGQEPRRIKLESFRQRTLTHTDLDRLVPYAVSSFQPLLTQLQEQASSLFPQEEICALIHPKLLVQAGNVVYAIDQQHRMLRVAEKSRGGLKRLVKEFADGLLFGKLLLTDQPVLSVLSFIPLDSPTHARYLYTWPMMKW
ncbi:hypothetical protein [Laceyella putida]|uniref:Uncharacterized protein n=1 Tax=Laceyella putida TaxID=110101 RepID=A0ABW2RND5_9BACL